jgi:hypothetical protein
MNYLHDNQTTKEMPRMNEAYKESTSLIFNHCFPYVKAKAKERGITITKLSEGFLVNQWDRVKTINSVSELEEFLLMVGVKL